MMGAPKGNNYWQFRGKHGNNYKYTPEELWQEAVKYFEWMSTRVWNKKEPIKSGDMAGTIMDVPTSTPMTIETFCLFADISRPTFDNYSSNKKPYKDFFGVTQAIKGIIQSQQLEGAAVGAYNANIVARLIGLKDRSSQELTLPQMGDGFNIGVKVHKKEK